MIGYHVRECPDGHRGDERHKRKLDSLKAFCLLRIFFEGVAFVAEVIAHTVLGHGQFVPEAFQCVEGAEYLRASPGIHGGMPGGEGIVFSVYGSSLFKDIHVSEGGGKRRGCGVFVHFDLLYPLRGGITRGDPRSVHFLSLRSRHRAGLCLSEGRWRRIFSALREEPRANDVLCRGHHDP